METFEVSLVKGQRYWLDSSKDVSGIFHGYGSHDELLFTDQQGKCCYTVSDDGFIRFSPSLEFYDFITGLPLTTLVPSDTSQKNQ